jgi:hypothetical protein
MPALDDCKKQFGPCGNKFRRLAKTGRFGTTQGWVAQTISPQISFGLPRFRGFQDPLAISHQGQSEGVCR